MSNPKIDTIFKKAKETLTENDKVKGLIAEVKTKVDKLNTDSEERSTFIYQLQVIVRMVRAHINGSYRAFSATTLLTLVFGLVYFITPVDLIPDFIPALGLTDDISLVYFIFKSMADDIARFRVWEEANA
ncbi:YkvA family protein [Marinoscillum sp.]|uniref:YkvA family protein n=1 Tax=Marinoscillum sp. TaxID=2024838 RepID=UPI003BA8B012